MAHVTASRIDDLEDDVILSELKKGNNGLEFSLDAPSSDENNFNEEIRVDTAYDYSEYSNHVNLECLDDSDESNSSPFDCIAKKMTNLTEDGGVKKQVKRAGFGPVVPEKALVYIHYNCYLELEEIPFDSSYLRSSNPLKYNFGVSMSYPGFEVAIGSMTQGEKSQFLIQPQYAFREMGAPPRIPPNATILLEVDLIKIVNCGDALMGVNETADYEDYKKFPEAFKKAKSLHIRGNDHFQNKTFNAAIDCYRKAANLLTSSSLANDEEECNQKHLLMKVYTNLSICYNKINVPQKACIAARDATHIDPFLANKNAKLHFNWGKALAKLSDFKRASDHFKKALHNEPNNKEVSQALLDLEKSRRDYYKHEKITYKKALGLNEYDDKSNQKDKNKYINDEIPKDLRGVIKELKEFAKSTRSRLDVPPSTLEEKQVIQTTCESLGLIYKEVKRPSGENIIAITK